MSANGDMWNWVASGDCRQLQGSPSKHGIACVPLLLADWFLMGGAFAGWWGGKPKNWRFRTTNRLHPPSQVYGERLVFALRGCGGLRSIVQWCVQCYICLLNLLISHISDMGWVKYREIPTKSVMYVCHSFPGAFLFISCKRIAWAAWAAICWCWGIWTGTGARPAGHVRGFRSNGAMLIMLMVGWGVHKFLMFNGFWLWW